MSEIRDLFSTLPVWARLKLFIHPGHKDWKQCNNCHVYKDIAALKACACSKARIRTVYYCGKECQRADWQNHKFDCKFFRGQGNGTEELPPNADKMTRRLGKMLAEWEFTNAQVVNWAMRVAYHYNPSICPSQVVFDVIVEAPSQQIVGFCFTSKSKIHQTSVFTLPEFKEIQGPDQLWYRIIVTCEGREGHVQPIHRAPLEHLADLHDMKFPEWPWIASELTRHPNNSLSIAKKKWELLITAVEFQRKEHSKFFSNFVAPKMCIDQRMMIDRMDDWYKAMTSFDTWGLLTASGYVAKVINRQ